MPDLPEQPSHPETASTVSRTTPAEPKDVADCHANIKPISRNDTALVVSTAPATESRDLEKAQRELTHTLIRPTITSQVLRNGIQRTVVFGTAICKAIYYVLLGIAIVAACLLPDGIYTIYAYYFSYAEIFFNSRVTMHIFRNVHTEGAFKTFYWIIVLLVTIVNGVFGYGVGMLGAYIGKGLKLRSFIMFLWMVPWVAAALGIKSICFWIRPVVRDAYQSGLFTHGCANEGWDLDIALGSPSALVLAEVLPVVGNANISWIGHPNDNYTAQLIRHAENHLHFDFVPLTFAPSSTHAPFNNITYDWQNNTYVAFRPDSTNVTGQFKTNPNLIFPSLNISTLDPFIPFQRPRYPPCWPAAATLMTRNSTASDQSRVLRTLTFLPSDSTRMKVCAMAGPDVAEKLQISLGVVLIDHYYFSLCTTRSSAQSAQVQGQPVGSTSDPETWNDGSDNR